MKKYIFITPTLSGMGGAQMYLFTKYNTLSSLGWDVSVLHASHKPSILPIFKDLDDAIPELKFSTFFYRQSTINKIIKQIISRYITQKYEEIIIESTCIDQATWGELLAKKVCGKHIAFLLQEDNTVASYWIDFIHYKHIRGELAGIRKEKIAMMFTPYMEFNVESAKMLTAIGCSHTVYDIDHPIIEQIKALKVDHIIGSIGRLDKPYVIPNLKEVYEFILFHSEEKFALVLLGGSNNQKVIQHIKKEFSTLSNCTLIITGFLFPLPKKIFSLIDVFFGTAGSANVAKCEGAISISIDAIDYNAIGVLGQSTSNSLARSVNEPPILLKDLLNDVLYKKKYKRIPPVQLKPIDYTTHFDFIDMSNQEKEYYDVHSIRPNSFKARIMSIIIKLFGPSCYRHLSEIRNR